MTSLLTPGTPGYSFGSFNDRVPATRFNIQKVAIASNVATIIAQFWEGVVPAVGALITTKGCVAIPNVTAAAIASISTTDGILYTITYPDSHANVSQVADGGFAFVPQQEVAVALTGDEQFGTVFAVQPSPNGFGISWAYDCPSAPDSLGIQLEGCLDLGNDDQWVLIGTAQTGTDGYVTVPASGPVLVNFVRVHVTASDGGTSPTVVAKILVS